MNKFTDASSAQRNVSTGWWALNPEILRNQASGLPAGRRSTPAAARRILPTLLSFARPLIGPDAQFDESGFHSAAISTSGCALANRAARHCWTNDKTVVW